MSSTSHASYPFGSAGRARPLEDAAERIGLALLVWALRHRATEPRTIDLGRVPRTLPAARPFC